MSDVQWLFLVVVLLYVWECACWVGGGTLLFRTWWGRRWRIAHPGSLLGNQRGGFVFGPLLPPLGTVFTGTEFPLALSPGAVLAGAAASVNAAKHSEPGESSFRWEDIRKIEMRGKKILVNNELLWKAPSPFLAWDVTQMLRELSQATPAEREKLIAQTSQARFDTSRIERQWREFQKHTSSLRLATNTLFSYLFMVAPLAIWHFGFLRCWLPLLAGLLALTSTIAILFHRAHKKFYPSAEDERFTHFLIFLLSPATAIRACDALSRPLLESYHPLAMAKVFCPDERFQELARRYWRELRYPARHDLWPGNQAAKQAESYSRGMLRNTVENFLKKNGSDPKALLQAPAPTDETCVSFCPRCLAQFTTSKGVCADCGGLSLMPFPGAQT